jgi:hypothetical protein
METTEYRQLLKQDVTAWNTWREQNRDITPDLRGVELIETGLTEAHPHGADLTKVV